MQEAGFVPLRPRKTHIGISVVAAKTNMPKALATTSQNACCRNVTCRSSHASYAKRTLPSHVRAHAFTGVEHCIVIMEICFLGLILIFTIAIFLLAILLSLSMPFGFFNLHLAGPSSAGFPTERAESEGSAEGEDPAVGLL